jgi:hypothetical protein
VYTARVSAVWCMIGVNLPDSAQLVILKTPAGIGYSNSVAHPDVIVQRILVHAHPAGYLAPTQDTHECVSDQNMVVLGRIHVYLLPLFGRVATGVTSCLTYSLLWICAP